MKITKPRAVLGIRKTKAVEVLARAQTIYNAMVAAVTIFVSPTVTMAVLLGLIQGLDTAQQATRTRAKGLAAVRDAKLELLWTALGTLRTYVQGISDTQTSESARSIIQAAGMLVAGVSAYSKPVLQAKLSVTPGVVMLIANATILMGASTSKRPTFNWQLSADGRTWTDAKSTPYGHTEIANLTALTTYAFRVR